MCVKAAALRRGFALGQLRAYPIGTTQSKRSSHGAFAERERENRFSWLDACQKQVGASLFETRPYRIQDDLMRLLQLSHSVVFRAG